MYSLVQSKRARGSAGEPLPTVFQSLAKADTHFLRGQLVLISAPPGTFKSVFALTLCIRAAQISGVRSLYFSADSDAFVQLSRTISIVTGKTMEESSELVIGGKLGDVENHLRNLPVRFNYDATPTVDSIELNINAYEELYGFYPEIIVIDNLTDVYTEGEGSDALDDLLSYLHSMARATEGCVIVLHHVKGEHNDGAMPAPLNGVKGQVGKVPEMILTFADGLKVATVKNRTGKADKSGRSYVLLDVDPDRALIRDHDPTWADA